MESRSYRYKVYGSKRRRLETNGQHMAPSITSDSVGQAHGNSGLFGFITRFLAPVTNFFRPTATAKAIITGSELPSSSSDSRSSRSLSKAPSNGNTQRVRRKRAEELRTSGDDEVIIIEQVDQIFVPSIPSNSSYSGKAVTEHVVEDKENKGTGLTEVSRAELVSEKSRKPSSGLVLSSSLAEAPSNYDVRRNNLLDETLKYESPSPQPENSISREASPFVSPTGSGISVDGWQRRRTGKDALSVCRYSPHGAFTPKCFNTSRERRFGGKINVIDKKGKERYRRFLEEAGIYKANKVPSHDYKRRLSAKRTDYVELLQRGKSALNSVSHSGSSSASTSRQGSVITISSNEVAVAQESDNRKDRADERSSHITVEREKSGSSSSSEEVRIIWDEKHREDVQALWDEEQNTKLLAKHRLEMYRGQVTIRERRAKELEIEKRLIEEARQDEMLSLEEQLRKKLTIRGYIFRPRKVEKDEFPELDEKAVFMVNRAWEQKLPSDEKLSGEITRKDLLTLRGLEWLNDEVINFYMNLICERAKNDESLPKVYAFSTFFYPALLGKGYTAVKRWTRKVDIFAHELLLVPVHLGAHWCLAVIDFTNKLIEYYDSMGGSNQRCLDKLSEYLLEESLDKRKKEFDLRGWELVVRDDIPQQMNGSDCGMFACKFAEYASRRAQISFTQEHMPYFRERMVYEICRQRLL